MIVDVIAAVSILAGSALGAIAGLGLQRFPDVFARMHAATKPATLGLVLILFGTALRLAQVGDVLGDVMKLILVLALQFVTAPVGAHLMGRAAYRTGRELSPDTVVDQLQTVDLEE